MKTGQLSVEIFRNNRTDTVLTLVRRVVANFNFGNLQNHLSGFILFCFFSEGHLVHIKCFVPPGFRFEFSFSLL